MCYYRVICNRGQMEIHFQYPTQDQDIYFRILYTEILLETHSWSPIWGLLPIGAVVGLLSWLGILHAKSSKSHGTFARTNQLGKFDRLYMVLADLDDISTFYCAGCEKSHESMDMRLMLMGRHITSASKRTFLIIH
ncbi:hypothetical protein K449DRAFT_437528 [Hypoxylon sp. EC38]|nr:hypothetical protein K449DRAFT_437528 [Hypoxylon sp. EC38]